ncbi:unnamed protein product [Spirodela intermedia]|uniref:Uncharacterized protein n=1 Tax=Spirodela intermedia TaxID=51605 RepID=A0A7I8K3S1_SPIIN|nr:unnamed protein product [Spirodela intermedia]
MVMNGAPDSQSVMALESRSRRIFCELTSKQVSVDDINFYLFIN